jgi:hypothetical protein
VYSLANCLISILRGTTTNRYGDEVDNGTVVASGIPALVTETNRTVYDRASQEARIIRVSRGAVQSDVDIRDNDQIKREDTNTVYMVQSVTQPDGAGVTTDLVLELKRVTGVG